MLRIKQVASYSVPKYPRELFHPWRGPAAQTYVRRGVAAAALLALLESCDGEDGSGPGPTAGIPRPHYTFFTENEARAIITNVFTDNGILLTPDVPMSIVGSQGDTSDVVLDGYNDSLRVGYEYIYYNDESSFTRTVTRQLYADAAGSGPYITAVEAQYSEKYLEWVVQSFIDTLKAHGKI